MFLILDAVFVGSAPSSFHEVNEKSLTPSVNPIPTLAFCASVLAQVLNALSSPIKLLIKKIGVNVVPVCD